MQTTTSPDTSRVASTLGVIPEEVLMPAEITRPVNGDLIIRMPYAKDNRAWLNRVAGRDPHVAFNDADKSWRVKRNRFERLIAALAARWGSVQVTQFGSHQTTCVAACWNGNPDKVAECECACAGSNHGAGTPAGREVTPGLSILTDYSRYTYRVRG